MYSSLECQVEGKVVEQGGAGRCNRKYKVPYRSQMDAFSGLSSPVASSAALSFTASSRARGPCRLTYRCLMTPPSFN